ncbi:MAG: tetratricopeptide repeat protein [Treponema sp.]|uniref:tetratricopeptide repeat protein n=1 Tax=Treponema sp. TaxID=166 RepID=UPI001B64DBF5|nr:tetratricopeptide repeat protein [Treponema sp.]MBP5402306.1 tetratricopeptide repeat protein [Treponema sp.]MBR5933195.1 tetratricopeptide repeat protein [Treponema sp.]
MIISGKKIGVIALSFILSAGSLFSQVFDADKVSSSNTMSQQSGEIFADALNAYKNYEWNNSIFLFKKLHANPENITPESMYILIMAQTYAGRYKQAADDCSFFLKNFPNSQYAQLVIYQKGKNLYQTGDYEKSIITLSDFCHAYPTHQLYAASLFWIAESFFATYNFDSAKPLYERIVAEFPEDLKAKDAKYRLDIIAQRGREEKLLYLLKQTGEDYLSSKEAYEKSLKYYNAESSFDVNNQLKELRQKNESLDADLTSERNRSAELEARIKVYENELTDNIRLLKERAKEAGDIINSESTDDE